MRPMKTSRPERGEPRPSLDASAVASFRASFRGELVLPPDEAYERARRVWNGAIDRHPALIARCSGVVDVVRAVEFAHEHELLVAVRGGAHNVAGHGTCDGGIVIDLSPMRGIGLDLARRTISVQAGAKLQNDAGRQRMASNGDDCRSNSVRPSGEAAAYRGIERGPASDVD